MTRLAACLELMERDGVDVLLLGREANARTVAPLSRLWLAGTRPFSPGCVVVRRTGAVHALAITDAVVATDFPVDRLYGITWNPEKLVGALAAIDGVRDARRVGVDGMSPMAHGLVTAVAPEATIVDAGPLFVELWGIADPEKVAGVEHAARVAGIGLGMMATVLAPGRLPRELRGAAAQAFATEGVTTPAFEAVAVPLGATTSTWMASERPLAAGEQVVLRAGALRDGWEASLARTYVVGTPSTPQPDPAGWDDLVAACIPGTTVGALRAGGAVVHGVGRGVEAWPDNFVLVPDLMAAIEVRADASLRQDVVRITATTPEVVTNPARVIAKYATA